MSKFNERVTLYLEGSGFPVKNNRIVALATEKINAVTEDNEIHRQILMKNAAQSSVPNINKQLSAIPTNVGTDMNQSEQKPIQPSTPTDV